MTQKLNTLHIVSIILTLVKCTPTANDELTLRNQLFSDVFILKEGVDHLQMSVEVLNNRYSNLLDKLKEVKAISGDDINNDICNKIDVSIYNSNRQIKSFEFNILTKLEQLQDEQTMLLDYIKLKRISTKQCSTPEDSTENLSTMSPILSDIKEKVDGFAEKLTKLEAMEEILQSQQTKLEQFNNDQIKILQDIDAKLTKNEKLFEIFEKEMPNIKNMLAKVDQVVRKEPRKLPMSLLMGITNANLTKS